MVEESFMISYQALYPTLQDRPMPPLHSLLNLVKAGRLVCHLWKLHPTYPRTLFRACDSHFSQQSGPTLWQVGPRLSRQRFHFVACKVQRRATTLSVTYLLACVSLSFNFFFFSSLSLFHSISFFGIEPYDSVLPPLFHARI